MNKKFVPNHQIHTQSDQDQNKLESKLKREIITKSEQNRINSKSESRLKWKDLLRLKIQVKSY